MTIEQLLLSAFEEDIREGDHTSLATIPADLESSAMVKAKEEGVIAGIEVALMILQLDKGGLQAEKFCNDGDPVFHGTDIMKISGNVRALLRCERIVLNCMQRMSGIATLTRKYVKAIDGCRTKIIDTRKTTPNFRIFEKMAVLAGGGHNHRHGLYDMILIKDNHVDAAGSVSKALELAHEYNRQLLVPLKIEIETRSLQEVEQVIKSGLADRIMLDNFSIENLRTALEMIKGKFETEASGGITLAAARDYALTGVDYISVGALTHSYSSLDINMKLLS